MITWTVRAVVKVHDRVVLPEAVTVPGDMVHAVLLDEKETMPLNPLTGVRVTVEVPVVPVLTVSVVGLALSWKSVTVNVIVVVWVSEPLAPVTATVTVDADENVHDRVVLPEPVTLVGETVQAVLLVVRLTVPAKPLRPVMVIVDVPGELTSTVSDVGFAVIWKSWTLKESMVEWDIVPLVPVTLTWKDPTNVELHDSVALPLPVRLVGVRVHAVLLVDKLVTPEYPNIPVTVMVEVPAVPRFTLTMIGLDVMLKSRTV
jgi:hypothetical protein